MISRHEMMSVLLESCPSFKPTWDEFQAEWKDSVEQPLYVALGCFARHLISLLETNEARSLPDVFRSIERLQVEGDEYVVNAAVIGILENLQNPALHERTQPGQIRPLLGPKSLIAWDDVFAFWTCGRIDPDSIEEPGLRTFVEQLNLEGSDESKN
jgi:hypothetical protein